MSLDAVQDHSAISHRCACHLVHDRFKKRFLVLEIIVDRGAGQADRVCDIGQRGAGICCARAGHYGGMRDNLGKGRRGLVAERGMWSRGVEILPPVSMAC